MKKRDYILAFSIVIVLFFASQILYDAFGIWEDGTLFERLFKILDSDPVTEVDSHLIVNPAFDGVGPEFLTSNHLDDKNSVVSSIRENISYDYFNEESSAIKNIETIIKNLDGKIIFRSVSRREVGVSDSSVKTEEIIISYEYTDDAIIRKESTKKFSAQTLLSSEETIKTIPHK